MDPIDTDAPVRSPEDRRKSDRKMVAIVIATAVALVLLIALNMK